MTDCACGCGQEAVYAASHVSVTIRTAITPADYVVMDCGYETPCWIWKGRRGDHYANVRVRGIQTSVHRAMYVQEVGPIPAGKVIDHLCDEKRCLRPEHLAAILSADNVRRSVGFNPTGAALDEILAYVVPTRALAERHSVSEGTITKVRRRHRQHVV